MKLFKVLAILLGLIIVGMIFVAAKDKKDPAVKSQPAIVSQPIEAPSNSDLIIANLGEEFIVRLAADPTVDYEWQAEFDSDFLEPTAKEYEPIAEPLPGSNPGQTKLSFQTLAAGETQVVFSYLKQGDRGGVPAKIVIKKIDILDPQAEAEAEKLRNIAESIATGYLEDLPDFINLKGSGIKLVEIDEARCPGCYVVKLGFDSAGQPNTATITLENWLAKSAIIERANK